jgi:hypothetical protein
VVGYSQLVQKLMFGGQWCMVFVHHIISGAQLLSYKQIVGGYPSTIAEGFSELRVYPIGTHADNLRLSLQKYCMYFYTHTAKTQYRKFETNKIFPAKELRGQNPNSYIHVSVSDLYIPTIGLPILLQENRWNDLRNI